MNNDFLPTKKQSGKSTDDTDDLNLSNRVDNELKLDDSANSTGSHLKPDFVIDETNNKSVGVLKVHHLKDRLQAHWPPGKKEWVVIAIMIILLLIFAFILIFDRTKTIQTASKIKATSTLPVSKLVPSTLSGLPVDPSINKIPVTGVMIENSTFARPQSGLSQAGVVFEAIAEGGITRFLALFQDTSPNNVGPIRSIRPYYEQIALGFDASIAHVGGSPEALQDMKSWNVKDLDQFANSGSYHRVNTRAAPHNVYTSIATLNQLEATKGFTSTTFTGFPRKAPNPAKAPNPTVIAFAISGPDYNVHYGYVPATNSYNRILAGSSHIDANTNAQISPKVVIAMVIPYKLEADGYHSDYTVTGSGQVFIFQDGTLQIGQWSKLDSASQIKFTDANGNIIKLNPGQTWISAVSLASNVTYAP